MKFLLALAPNLLEKRYCNKNESVEFGKILHECILQQEMIHKQQFNQSYFVRSIVVLLCDLGVNAAAVFSTNVLRRKAICDEVIPV